MTVVSGLTIVTNPSNQTVSVGQKAVFTVQAQGEGLKYQWQYLMPGRTEWWDSGMAGATTASISVEGTAARNGQQYRCVVTDANGNQLISNAAKMTVVSGLTIVTNPSNQTVSVGQKAVFTVVAQGEGLKYQWQYLMPGRTEWWDSGMTGANTSSISVEGTMARNGQQYRCVVTDASGNQLVSNAATMIVTD